MHLTKEGQSTVFDGKTFTVGMPIKAIGTNAGFYEGLYGRITEIVDGNETDNDTPDIYCDFDLPENPKNHVDLERRYHDFHNEFIEAAEISLDGIIMAPSMLAEDTRKLYCVIITEMLQMSVETKAENEDEAEEIIEQNYKNSEYILDAEQFAGVEFSASELDYSEELTKADEENEEDMEV